MTQILDGKVVIITGASSGIGKACAIAFGKAGGKLAIGARNEQNLQYTAQELQEMGIEVITVPADVSIEENCRALIDATIEKYGRIDILINNAGISMRALFLNMDIDVFEKVMDVNFRGTVYCTKYALPHILKTKGSIVGVSSIAGSKGLPGRTAYSASKFAMQGFLEALRIENRGSGIHVLIACPGFTSSNIRRTALKANGSLQAKSPREEKKLMSSEEVAEHILNAVQKKKHKIILTRKGKLLVWLTKFLPGLADKLVFKNLSKEPGSPF